MAKADDFHTTNRRKFLSTMTAGVAAIAATAAALAGAARAALPIDPIFAATDEVDSEDRTARPRQPRRSPLEPIEFDWEAITERAEQIVEILRACVGCDGIELDELGADRLLQWCRSMSAGEPDDRGEFPAINVFLERHGQSIDWLLTGNAQILICYGAKLNVLGLSHRVYDHTPN
jgi:hypothetical protein